MRKWNLSLTYAPKIEGVCDGSITQTMRVGRKYNVGDVIAFHGWSGRPYRSQWSWRTPYFPVVSVATIWMYPSGIRFGSSPRIVEWGELDWLAKRDGIAPPTGLALRDVLFGMNPMKGPAVGAQIIRWDAGESMVELYEVMG